MNAGEQSPVTSALRPAAFFDRDGVINVDHGYIGSVDRFDLVGGAAEALRSCRSAGFLVFVVTNQAGVAYGYFDEAAVTVVHDHMRRELTILGAHIDDICYCPHHINGAIPAYARQCDCRKPGTGMILELACRWGVDLDRSFLVGDKESDMEAALAAGLTGHLFAGGDLAGFVQPILAAYRAQLAD